MMFYQLLLNTLAFLVLSQLAVASQEEGADNDHPHVSRQALIQGTYATGEVVSKTQFFQEGQRLKVEWVAKPATGDCIISLFSIFNADLLFSNVPDDQKPPWSEIAWETFGGSSGTSAKQFQTQYISQDDPDAEPTKRGKQHVKNHFLGQSNIPDIYDGQFHTFEIEWLPKDGNTDSEIVYILDGQSLRTVTGGDANYLEPPLDIYAGVWVTNPNSNWGCTARRRLQSGYCNWSGCNGVTQGGPWCNESQDRCNNGCGGTWCNGGPPAPSPVSSPTSPPTPAPVPAPTSSPGSVAEVVVQSVKVYSRSGNSWNLIENYPFNNNNDLYNRWTISNWGFSSFDGAFDGSAVRVGNGQLVMDVLEN